MKLPREFRRTRGQRKQREDALPSKWVRSKSGRAFKLVKTAGVNAADEWLYRLDSGDIVCTGLWSRIDLERAGCVFLDDQPADWHRGEWRQKAEPCDASS